jgi:membrane protein implicated in regulation of membrane protease activity
MRSVFREVASESKLEGSPTELGTRSFRFGIGMLVLACFTAVVGAYPIAIDMATRVMFLLFAVVLALLGAHFIDRSSRPLNRAPQAGDDEEGAPQAGIRRLK